MGGVAEVSVLRKAADASGCFGGEEEVPYHNGIFAQNSIKLAMRKYESPATKSSSEAEFQLMRLALEDGRAPCADAAHSLDLSLG